MSDAKKSLLEKALSDCLKDIEIIFISQISDNDYYINESKPFENFFKADINPFEQLISGEKIYSEDKAIVSAFCSELISLDYPIDDKRYGLEFRVVDDNNTPLWVRLMCTVVCDDENIPQSILARMYYLNPSEIMKITALDSKLKNKDQYRYLDAIQNLIESNGSSRVAIVQFDIVNFKHVNTRYSERVGNEVLSYISSRLTDICDDDCVHFRMGSDIFCVAMLYSDISEINEIINAIEAHISEFDGIRLRYAFGVYVITDKSMPIRTMIDYAAIARKSIKGNALQNVGIYSEVLSKNLDNRHFVEDRMEYALKTGEFTIYLQPKYSISDGKIVGAEALVRWIHPEKGIIPPMDFVPIFEQNGFITKLDEYVWEKACILLSRWLDMGYKPMPISVNISRVHLKSERFINVLDHLIKKYNIPQYLLETEITETVDNVNANNMIRELKNRGYVLLMDDFGSGYSSLNTLKSTPFDVIKIDRAFLSEFMSSDRGKKIISHTISMSKDIGLDLVAEGVETKEQAEFLHNCGCDIAQGYYYSKPIDAFSFEQLAFPNKMA